MHTEHPSICKVLTKFLTIFFFFSLHHFPLFPLPLSEILLLQDVISAVSDLSDIIF